MKRNKREWKIERAIEQDKPFMSRLFWEYRQHLLDELDALRELGIKGERESILLDTAKDMAFISWFYGGDRQ